MQMKRLLYLANILRLDVSEGQIYRNTDVIQRSGKLYDKQIIVINLQTV